MHLVVPLKIGCDSQNNFQSVARDGLDVRAQIQARKVVNVLVQRFPVLKSEQQQLYIMIPWVDAPTLQAQCDSNRTSAPRETLSFRFSEQ